MAGMLKAKVYSVVGPRVLQPMAVVEVRDVAPAFRLIALQRQDTAPHTVGPADKLRVNTLDWQVRTYTPLKFTSAPDRYEILAYVHGHGPGSAWAAGLQQGATTHSKNPKPTVTLEEAPLVLMGDETSLGTALNFKDRTNVQWVLEVAAPKEVEALLTSMGLRGTVLVPKAAGDAHREEVAHHVETALSASGNAQALLTGRAQTIQAVLKGLRTRKAPVSRVSVKPYWSDKKVGLD